MRQLIRMAVALFSLSAAGIAGAATEWNTQEYDLYSGDFNGDGKSDILYVAKDQSKASGIALSDGSGPNIAFQSWPSNYLGIPWSGNLYTPIVADFNGDQRADILMHRSTPGDHYLIHANAEGKITGISQGISNSYGGKTWSGNEHKLIAGDFSGDGRADLFLQATTSSIENIVFLVDTNGYVLSTPAQTWSDGYLGFKWSTRDAFIYAGNFNGTDSDGYKRADLLIQARPRFVMIDYDVAIPVPTYPPNMNGIVKASSGSPIFQATGSQAWSRTSNGVDWSPLSTNVIVGDFNGDGNADVILQARNSSKSSYLLTGNSSGSALSSGTQLASNISWSSDSYRLIATNFDGGADGIYFQSVSSSGSNSYAATVTGGSVSTVGHDPTNATGVVPTTAVGHTVGSFAVSNTGAATYSIPIVVPPGIGGIQPALAVNYTSGSGNGLLGVGWDIDGFSEIERCGKTMAQDGAPGGVQLTTADHFCLDGNKLRLTGGTYGAANSTYQTELETFARVTAYGTAGNGPSYFEVLGKDGLIYTYGNTNDSRIEAVNSAASTTVFAWALNQVRDRSGNTMTFTYLEDGAPNGSYRPSEISYTTNSTAGVSSPAYKVVFTWETRPDTLIHYVAGGRTTETKRLSRIETQYYGSSWSTVRKYQLSYNNSSATGRSRLKSVQECGQDGTCLAPTTIAWQDGLKGWAATDVVSTSDSSATMAYAHAIDFDGDGFSDLVYPQGDSSKTWYYMKGSATGLGTPMNTGIAAGTTSNLKYAGALPIDFFGNGKMGLLADIPSYSTRQILRWDAATSAFTLTSTNLADDLDGINNIVADFDGDGRQDFLNVTVGGGTASIYVYKNNGSNFGSAVLFYSEPNSGLTLDGFNKYGGAALTHLTDFNGDGRADVVLSDTAATCDPVVGCIAATTWWTTLTSTGSSFVATAAGECNAYTSTGYCNPWVQIGDYNGDGYSDLLRYNNDHYEIAHGSSAGVSQGVPVSMSISTLAVDTQVVDYDGDGRTDFLFSDNSSSWYVARSTGTGFETAIALSVPYSSDLAKTFRLADFDGDGQVDIGYKNTQYRVRKHNGSAPDFASAFTDGFGNSVGVTYAPLTDSAVYTVGTGATFPVVDIRAPMYVVKQFTASDGIGGSYSVSESYAAARVHVQGRGFLGFASRTTTDGRNGIKSVTNFSQTFPYIGLVTSSTTSQSSSGPAISQVTNTLAELPVQGTAQVNDRHLPYLRQSIESTYEVGGASNGQEITRITTTTELDTWGNLTGITTTTADMTGTGQSFTSVTANSYNTSDTECWARGFVTQQQVTNTVPGLSALTRTVQFVKDSSASSHCRVYQQLIEPTDPDANLRLTKTFAFDAFGHATSETVSGTGITSRTTQTSFGSRGVFPETVTNALGQSASKTYNYALGVPLTATDPNGLQVSYTYDGFGRLTAETRPDGTKTLLTYSSCTSGNNYCGDNRLRYRVQKQELDATNPGNVIRQSVQLFDAFGRSLYDQAQTISGAYSNVASNYDNQGRLTQRSAPYFSGFAANYTNTSYDLIGRPTQDQRPISETDSGLQATQYGYNRLTHTVTDANGRTTTKVMNAIGQAVQTTDAADTASGVTYFQYDQFGNLTKTIDPLLNEIRNQFNIRGFKTQTRDPDTGTWNYTYYPTGELKTQTDAKSQTVTFTYDQLGRPLTRVEAEGTTTFNYGTTGTGANRNIGRLASVYSPGSYSEVFTYDNLARLQSTTTNADATAYVVDNSYNATTGLLETTTYPTSTSAVTGSRFKVKYEYEYGLLKRTRDFNTPATIYWEQVASNAAGQAVDEQLGNGLHTYSAYDGITGLLGTRQAGSGNGVQNLTYQWDKVGNLTQRSDLRLGFYEGFYYDSLNRLDYSKLNNVATPNLDVGYDALGNIKSKSGVGSYTYAPSGTNSIRPHAVTAAGSNSYAYDNNGNMTTKNGSSITWYSYNLPNTINKGSNSSQFFYGADRQRYKQIAVTAAGGSLPAGTETTIYVGSLFEKVTKPSAVVEYKHYIMAGGEPIAIRTLRSNSTNDTRYLHKDHLGSVDTITNESGGVVQRLSYDAFGKRRSATAWSGALAAADWTNIAAITHRAFTFHEQLDNVELVHMNGRVYDPDIGRFISADPFIQAPLMSQSLNRYSYVMNNPLSLVDPSGYFFKSLWKGIKRFAKKWGGTIIGVGMTLLGQPWLLTALMTASYTTAVNGGNFIRNLTMAGIAAGIGAAVGQLPIPGGTGLLGRMTAGALSGAITGGIVSTITGGSFRTGFTQGALVGGAVGAVAWGMDRAGLLPPAAQLASNNVDEIVVTASRLPFAGPLATAARAAANVWSFFKSGRPWHASVGVGGAVHGPVLGHLGIGVSVNLSFGFSYEGNILDSRFFGQFQVAGMVGTGIYAGWGVSAQGGPGAIGSEVSAGLTSHSELNVGAGVSGSVVVDQTLDGIDAGGYHGRLPYGRFGEGMGLAAGTGIALNVTAPTLTIRELLGPRNTVFSH